MSRSNPTSNNTHPSTRWFEWKGGDGKLVWYDRDKKETVDAPKGFTFLVLDQLSTVTGYNDKEKRGITANEVRDVRAETLLVKYFKGDTIAEGFWNDIKEKVAFKNGKFACSVYIAFKDGDELKIGNIRLSGCSLGPWFDFVKEHRADINTKAVLIKDGAKDTSGKVDFVPPVFGIKDTTDETNASAVELDKQVQEYLAGYFGKSRTDQSQPAPHEREKEPEPHRAPEPEIDPDDVPY